jgi:hypothetical protein
MDEPVKWRVFAAAVAGLVVMGSGALAYQSAARAQAEVRQEDRYKQLQTQMNKLESTMESTTRELRQEIRDNRTLLIEEIRKARE